jgi:hypothetical protein
MKRSVCQEMSCPLRLPERSVVFSGEFCESGASCLNRVFALVGA